MYFLLNILNAKFSIFNAIWWIFSSISSVTSVNRRPGQGVSLVSSPTPFEFANQISNCGTTFTVHVLRIASFLPSSQMCSTLVLAKRFQTTIVAELRIFLPPKRFVLLEKMCKKLFFMTSTMSRP